MVLGFMTQGMAQSEDYQPFFEGNPVYSQVWENRASWGYWIPIKKHGLEGDTVVDGLLYHKLAVTADRAEDEKFWVRESEAHDKVWVRLPWDTTEEEFLVVDMNLSEGDSFMVDMGIDTIRLCDTTWDTEGNAPVIVCMDTVVYTEICYVVDSVYYLEHPGGVLKHIRLHPQDYHGYTEALEDAGLLGIDCAWRSHHLEFIEGVGTNLGFVYRRLGVPSFRHPLFHTLWNPLWEPLYPRNDGLAPTDYVVCVERDGGVYYVHPNAECMDCDSELFDKWMDGAGDPRDPSRPRPANERVQSMSRYLLVSPNPAAETATLQWDAATDSRVSMAACNVMLYD
ncbi:MAG: hypothetical protein K2L03_07455, partial [Bacteroidales bacterium]|nr:hypothetical protein [Bacteroidales bacterium]